MATTEHAVMIAGGGPTGLMLAGEQAEEPEWSLRRDARGVHSLQRHRGWGPVRRCNIP
ncbi:MAG TPA: hypothetical protein VK066_01730 [Chloroflexota bacterium]|nr:hypothetical protein [Chloroflexota bacterium]